MRLHFHDRLASEGEDRLEPALRFDRRERKEEVREPVTPGKRAVDDFAIESVAEALFAGPE